MKAPVNPPKVPAILCERREDVFSGKITVKISVDK